MTESTEVRIPTMIDGVFVRNGKGPLGQSKARYPIGPNYHHSNRTVMLTRDEIERLTQCTCCGRATVNPKFHRVYHYPAGTGHHDLPHCEICDSFRDENGKMTGWYGGPYEVIA